MSKIYKKVSIVFVVAFTIMLGCYNNVLAAADFEVGANNLNNTTENSAKVGQQLTHPEKGWKRYDDANSKIIYGSQMIIYSVSGTYNEAFHECGTKGGNTNAKTTIKFYGTKFRIIAHLARNGISSQMSKNISVTLDGTLLGKMNEINSTDDYVWQTLNYEKTGLTQGFHTVVLNPEDGLEYLFDAIDIDDTGYLVNPSDALATGIVLNKTTDSLQTGETDTLVATVTPENATNKNVKWTSSDPSIATVDENGKVTAIKEGTATITATTTDGSNLSASCTVTVTSVPTNTGNAILTITMTNGTEKEYDLSMTEVNAFINWYNGRAAGTGNAYYTFTKNSSLAAFTKRTEYILYDKIVEFNVDEYTVQK